MNDHQIIGPVMVDIEGLKLSEQDRQLLLNKHVGGIIFFSRNFQSHAQIKSLVDDIRSLRPELLLAVDQEGGRVQRFKSGFTAIPPMQLFDRLYNQDADKALALAQDTGWLMAAEILCCGIDFSFAPVLDVDQNHCSVISDRAFSSDPRKVSLLAGAFISGMHEAGMAATGKHFPGHGKVSGDSHLELPVDSRPWSDIADKDLIPFQELSSALDAIMPAHILFSEIDQYPVGFSQVWLQNKLRHHLQFQGVIFSDDLSMEGAAGYGCYADRAEAALHAGCDMVLVCNNRKGAEEVLARIETLGWQASPHLATMRQRRKWHGGQLENNTRWRQVVKSLSLFNRV